MVADVAVRGMQFAVTAWVWGQRIGDQQTRLKVVGKVLLGWLWNGSRVGKGCGPRTYSQSSGAGLVEAVSGAGIEQ